MVVLLINEPILLVTSRQFFRVLKQNVSYFEFYKQSKDGVIIWQMQQQKEFIAIIIKSDLYFDACN